MTAEIVKVTRWVRFRNDCTHCGRALKDHGVQVTSTDRQLGVALKRWCQMSAEEAAAALTSERADAVRLRRAVGAQWFCFGCQNDRYDYSADGGESLGRMRMVERE